MKFEAHPQKLIIPLDDGLWKRHLLG